jgi:aspartate 1-decarboxylase
VCRAVDISGVEIVEVKTIAEGNRFRTFVLVALPTGDANAIQKRKDQVRAEENARIRGEQVFREMDKQVVIPAQ